MRAAGNQELGLLCRAENPLGSLVLALCDLRPATPGLRDLVGSVAMEGGRPTSTPGTMALAGCNLESWGLHRHLRVRGGGAGLGDFTETLGGRSPQLGGHPCQPSGLLGWRSACTARRRTRRHCPWSREAPRPAGCPSPTARSGLPPPPQPGWAAALPAARRAYCSAVTSNGCRSTGPEAGGEGGGVGRAGEMAPNRALLAGLQEPGRKHSEPTAASLVFSGCDPRWTCVSPVLWVNVQSQAASRKGVWVTSRPAKCLKTVPGG